MNIPALFLKPALLLSQAADTTANNPGGGPGGDKEPDPLTVEALTKMVQENALQWAINLGIAILILIVGRIVVGMVTRGIKNLMKRAKVDAILIEFLGSMLSGVLMLFVLIAAIKELGFDTSSMVALIGAAGLAIGFAMQDSLSNFASGVMLIVFRPFKDGDFVEAGGVAGVVEKINIFTTTMRTGDNREIIVPNGSIFGGTITNYSARPTRRVDMLFGIGYGDDLLKAKRILEEIVANEERCLKDPSPVILVNDLGESSVNFKVRPWVNSGDYWDVLAAITEKVKLSFDKEGISIPFPQMDVHLHKEVEND